MAPDDADALALPEQPALDLESAAALAVLDAIGDQLAGQPGEDSVAVEPRAIARAVLELADAGPDRYPRIPDWVEPRTVGGTVRAGATVPEPEIRVQPGGPGQVTFTVTGTGEATVPAADAAGWLLAGLSACRTNPG